MWYRAADRITHLVINQQIEVRAARASGRRFRQTQCLAALPPTVLCKNSIVSQRCFQLCSRLNSASRRLDRHPVSLRNTMTACGTRMNFDQLVALQTPEGAEIAMLTMMTSLKHLVAMLQTMLQ